MKDWKKKVEPEEQENEMARKAMVFLWENYQPAATMAEATHFLSTLEIWRRLQENFPGDYMASEVATWLQEDGFILRDMGNLKADWLLKKVNKL